MPRKYEKKSEYWNNLSKVAIKEKEVVAEIVKKARIDIAPEFDGTTHYTAVAACGGGDDGAGANYRDSFASNVLDTRRYKNIRSGIVPFFAARDGYYSVGDAISLMYQAYFNVAIVRNTINMLQDYSCSKLKIKTTNKTVERFFKDWLSSININDFMMQFFLEYYRSGNVFIYKFNGRVPDMKFNMLKQSLGARTPELPVRYIILNPMQIYLQVGPTYSHNFTRMLSTYEIQRLREPKTAEDKAVFNSMPKAIQEQIKNFTNFRYLYVPLEPDRLYYSFYRKLDYEPLAIPPFFPVLNDIELKLELKKMDMSLARMMEQVLLLVTTGEKADQYNDGLNPKNLQVLQNIFKNQTIGRVLVADYTTKAEWKIPDLKELLGDEKYKRVDQDIKEGLQYIFFSNDKFAGASLKANLFIEGLKEGRRQFLETFLMPEVKKVCQIMNFKQIPEIEFEQMNVQDPTALQRLYYQMAQIGLLTEDELMEALQSGILPDKESSIQNQEEYKKLRDKGLYQPMLGGKQDGQDGNMGRPSGTGKPMPGRKSGQIGVKASVEEMISSKKVIDNIADMNSIEQSVIQAYKKKFKIDNLSEIQNTIATAVAKSIIVNEEEKNWKKSVNTYIKSPKDIPEDINKKLNEISAKYEVDDWTAIVLLRSKLEEDIKNTTK
jgi:hypothetical protein